MGTESKKEMRPVQERPLHDKLTNKDLIIVKQQEWFRELSLEKSINYFWNLKK
jgi:hypothetical protein